MRDTTLELTPIAIFQSHGSLLEGLGKTIDLLSSYGGMPYSNSRKQTIVALSPAPFLNEIGLHRFRANFGAFVERLLCLDAEGQVKAISIMADRSEAVQLLDEWRSFRLSPAEGIVSNTGSRSDKLPRLKDKLEDLIERFVLTKTLDARISAREADELYRLGRLIAALNGPALAEALTP